MKTKLLFSLLIVSLFLQSSFKNAGLGTLKGKITDFQTGKAIPYALVSLSRPGVQKKAIKADVNGNYQLVSIQVADYDLVVIATGYETTKKSGIKIIAGSVSIQNIAMKKVVAEVKKTDIPKGGTTTAPVRKSPSVTEKDETDYKTSGRGSIPVTVSEDAPTFSYAETIPSDKSKSISPTASVRPSATTVPAGKPGVLTAGVLNDFNKWELWKDISQTSLLEWQKQWKIIPENRYTLQVVNKAGKAVIDAVARLKDKKGEIYWTARTDNTGKAELWAGLYDTESKDKSRKFHIEVEYKNRKYQLDKAELFGDAINIVKIPVDCDVPSAVDVMFVVDATGSMGDEIEYLKAELNDIIAKVKNNYPAYQLNLGSVFYRDKGDEYITRKNNFSIDINNTIDFIKSQSAAGGGDMCEAVDSALSVAINMKWSENATARLLFLVLDAPAHSEPQNISSIQKSVALAATKGIRIIPITGSGLIKSGEYLLRSVALATNGTYVFLTDHSGVGGTHLKPSTDEYDVTTLNDVLLKIFYDFMFAVPCNENNLRADSSIRDTMYVRNPKLIDHVIADSTLLGKFNQYQQKDSNKISFADSLKIRDSIVVSADSMKLSAHDSITNPKDSNTIGEFHYFRFYPNPSNGLLSIEIKGKIREIYLADISGKLLEKFDVSGRERIELDISQYPTGIYFLQYNLDGKWLAGKILLNTFNGTVNNGNHHQPGLK